MSPAATENDEKVLVGVIGGSGLYNLDNLKFIKHVRPETPWGLPSSDITICETPAGIRVAFLARHGPGHTISPSHVPSRANIAAFKHLGVRAILAFSAVGSLREEIAPGAFALPSQIIDRTKGIRPHTFFDGTVVAHCSFGDPFGQRLSAWLEGPVRAALAQVPGRQVQLFTDKCIVCMEGPQFSTRAESEMYRMWGGDLINMSVLPEAKLAREAEISYALIATATDYDSWRQGEEAVTAAEVFKTLQANADASRLIAEKVLDAMHEAVTQGDVLSEVQGSMKFSIMPRAVKQDEADLAKLHYILPEYF
ncbi:nucleoside phosphorylase domain-containing protein [Vararia minispora EC-137]|uniref:Nucleoside phosphorylase domain-containing protein n=1 Tax=Vararia minispora EC-137 TaxID=1314806 RepID=A0ACB8QA56_9AGAM|nr:nucleoside phosphorylase domain-containing protein [Vararia minispora EC-137]